MHQLSDSNLRARKSHTCSLCHRSIEPGEIYNRQVNAYDGRAWTFKTCVQCDRMNYEVGFAWIEYSYGNDAGYTHETVHDWYPSTIREARLKIGWKRKWRHRDGTLYAIADSLVVV